MKFNKLNHFNAYGISFECLLLIITGFLLSCGSQKQTKQVFSTHYQVSNADSVININTASAAELEQIPHVGAKLAQKIIDHRERYGKFRKTEHLLLVDGISNDRFREIKGLVKVE